MVSDTYYNAMGSRSFYKGTSFRCTEWCLETHYFNNEDFIDFVSYKGALLRCTRSHISSVDNEPSLVINNNLIVGINDSPVWEFIMGGGSIETGQLNIDFKLEDGHLWVFCNEKWKDLGNVKGDQGETGIQGIPGDPGKGVPSGGNTNQVLVKQSNSDYDTIWKTINTSGGELPTFSAKVLSTTSTEDAPEATVTLSDSNEFQFSFKLQKGQDGVNGTPGINGGGLKYIYIRTTKANKPTTPTGSGEDVELPTDVEWGLWKSSPTGVDSTYRWEWVSASVYINGSWESYSEPSLFAYYALDGVNRTDGIYTDYKFAKSSSKSEVPSINKQSSNPGSNWSDQWPVINSGEFLWMTFIKKNSKDDSIVLGEEWATPVCITGEQGPQGPIGSTGASGTPGVGIVMRFCNGTDTEPSNAKPTNTLDTASQGWTVTPPSTTEDYPRLWFIQGRIKYLNNEDRDGQLDGSWSDPALFNGPAGVNGEAGKKGQLIYPAGVYDINTTYSTTEESAPYVYVYNSESSKSGYYLLSAVTSWTGTDHNNWSPVESIDNEEHYWTKFNHFEAIFADVSIFPNSLVGSAVFNGDYMFSQTGKESTGITTNYNKFDPEDLSKWYPAYYINLRTGECSLNFGQCTFKYSDSFNSKTLMTIEGGINIIPDMISPSRYSNYISTPCISILADEEGLANGNIYKFALSEEYLPITKGVIKGSIDNCTYLNGLEENDEDYVVISPAESTESSNGIINFVTYQNGTIRSTISEIYLGAGRTLSYSFVPIKYLGDSLYSTYTSIFDVADTEDGTTAYRGISGILNISNVNDFVLIVCHQSGQGIQYGGLTFTKAGSFLVSKVLDVNPVK